MERHPYLATFENLVVSLEAFYLNKLTELLPLPIKLIQSVSGERNVLLVLASLTLFNLLTVDVKHKIKHNRSRSTCSVIE